VLGDLQVGARELQLLAVLALVALDLLQLHVGEVVGLDGRSETVVDLLDLGEDPLRLRPLRRDGRGRRISRCHGTQRGENGRAGQAGTASYVRRRKRTPKAEDERLRLSPPAASCQR